MDDFKYKGDAVVPVNDAPIVRDLLIESVNDDDDNMIYDWFNGNIDTGDSQQAMLLFVQLKPVVMHALMNGETDEATVDEWLSALSAAINQTTAANTLTIKRLLEQFRNDSLAVDMNIGIGDIVIVSEDGSRSYGKKGRKHKINIVNKTIDEVLDKMTILAFWLKYLGSLMNMSKPMSGIKLLRWQKLRMLLRLAI